MISTWINLAFAAGPVVAVGNGVVAAPPPEIEVGEVAGGAWVSVVGDCLEEARPGAWPVVDRSKHGSTASLVLAEVPAIRALTPSAVLIGVGAQEMRDASARDAFVATLRRTVGALRADGGPIVVIVGVVSPTLEQLAWGEPVEPRQLALDTSTTEWNASIAKLAGADEGVAFVDLWTAWPRDGRTRRRLTRAGWGLTDPAHARVGAQICEELLKKLKNEAP